MTAMRKCSKENKTTLAQSGATATEKNQQAQALGLKGKETSFIQVPESSN